MDTELFKYLDTACSRLNTDCVKWDNMPESDVPLIPMWVADMDFPTAPAIAEALQKRAAHPIYGYTAFPELSQAETDWLKRRHNLTIQPEWIIHSPGVVDSMFFCVRALTKPEDKILVFTPCYGPFFMAVNTFERPLVKSRLLDGKDGDWKIDFDDVEAQFKAGVKMLLLCNPHNPIGRLWSTEELTKLVALANAYNVILVADEIHAEFAFDGKKTVRILSVPGTEKCIMLTSATKSFNIAGLRLSSIIVPDEAMRNTLDHELTLNRAKEPNLFGAVAQTAAYQHGDAWMDALIEYIQGNRDYTVNFIRQHIPEIKCYPQQGTYLMWLDASGIGMDHDALQKFFIEKAHVFLSDGKGFGDGGELHFRFNLATQRANVIEALNRIEKALHN